MDWTGVCDLMWSYHKDGSHERSFACFRFLQAKKCRSTSGIQLIELQDNIELDVGNIVLY